MRANRSHATNRRGIAMVLAVVCLFLLTVLLGLMFRAGISERRVVAREQREIQARWLADAGLERAYAKLAESSEYSGEVWKLDAESLGGFDIASVSIAVSGVADSPRRRLVQARAEVAPNSNRRVRIERDAIVDLPVTK